MKTRDQIIADHPLDKLCASWGVTLKPNGKDLSGLCPLHKEKTPSFHVNLEKKLWNCFGCSTGGSVIDLVMRKENISMPDAMRKLGGEPERPLPPPAQATIVATYSYRDEQGEELFQVVRMNPKTFRQRHGSPGNWVWSMDGVRRVLYNLPKILKANSPYVWITEGEKDADNLTKLALTATTNVGGAGKWMDGYNDCLTGKEIILCGDNDGPGRAHVSKLADALAKKAKTIRVITIPDPHKDVSDFIASFPDLETAFKELFKLFESAVVLTGGVAVPVQTMAELELEYIESLKDAQHSTLNLAAWLPSFAGCVRGLVPGELITILANTGVGKTAALQNIAVAARPIQTLLFELELPGTLTFERFASIATNKASSEVMTEYNSGQSVPWKDTGLLNHINVCSRSRLSPDEIERIILQTELKTGHRPRLVLLDYMGLIEGTGSSRYERVSHVAEQMKVVAKATKTIIIIASQVSRKKSDDSNEVTLSDGKDSGSIENSSGLVLGLWRESQSLLNCKILKNTKGIAGKIIQCQFNGATLQITEQPRTSPIDPSDIPRNPHTD